MILINKGATNSVALTLNEKLTSTASNIFIQFYSNQDRDSKLMWLNTDVSPDPVRWNQYEIEETTNEDLNDQKISLDVTTYDYFVYETAATALSIASASNVLESGKVTVIGTSSEASIFDDDRDEYTFY